MANVTNTNLSTPADFKVFLSTLKGVFSKSDVVEFAKFKEEYDRVGAERLNFTRDAATNHIREINLRAQKDASAENVEAVKKCSPAEVYSRYDHTANQICLIQQEILKRAKPLLLRLREAVLPIVKEQIGKIEAEARARFAAYGVAYDPSADTLLLSLCRWRDIVSDHFSGELVALNPKQVTDRLGEIRKAGLLG